MTVLLNAQILAGTRRAAAELLVAKWNAHAHIEWIQSPAHLCVLRIDLADDAETSWGRPTERSLQITNDLELALRGLV